MREYIKLCDVCDFQGGSQPPKDEWSSDFKAGYIRMLQIRDFTQSERVVPEYIKITKTTKTCEVDDILIARYGASLGKILTGLAGAYNVAIMRTIPDTNVLEKKYLYYFLKSPVFQGFLLNVGSRAAQAGFNKNDLQDLFIPNITRNEQVKIIGILERVETVIEARQKELQKLDDLIKARFIEMFGDPVLNERKFPTLSGADFFKLSNGRAVPDEKRIETGIPAYGGNGISWYTDEFLMAEDTIVVGRVGFQSGNVHYVIGPLWITDNAMYISQYDKDKFNLRFLCELMQHVNFSRFQDAGDLKKITQKPFMTFKYILPSMDLQQKFVNFKIEVDKSREEVKKSLEKTQQLYDSLMQEYFG